MLTPTQYQQQIQDEVGAALADHVPGVVVPNIATIWNMWSQKAYGDPPLQYFYARLTALDRILGQFRAKISQSLGQLAPNLKQKFDNLLALRQGFVLDIQWHEELAAANRTGVVEQITRTAPRTADDVGGGADPNDPRYRGDALVRS